MPVRFFTLNNASRIIEILDKLTILSMVVISMTRRTMQSREREINLASLLGKTTDISSY